MYLPNNYTFFIIAFRNISQSKCSDLHILSINFCLRICRINIAQMAASKVQTITHIFYHLPLKVMFHEKICKIDNCNLQNVSARFFFSCEVLTSYLAICKSIKSMEGWMVQFCGNSSLWVMGPYFYVAITEYGHPERVFFRKSQTFGLRQINWAEMFGSLWVFLAKLKHPHWHLVHRFEYLIVFSAKKL